MAPLDLKSKSTALLVMDCQMGIVGGLTPADQARVTTNIGRAIKAARKAGMRVIYVVLHFRDGYPEISDRNKMFAGVKQGGYFKEGSPEAAICPQLVPQHGDVVVVKKRISGFTGSDLQAVLASQGIDTLVLTGVSSLGVVESTARRAFDMDYSIIVLGDCCADAKPEAHDAAVKWLLPWLCTVASVADFEAALSR